MKDLALHNVVPIVLWEYNTRYIYGVDAKRVTTIVKHISILVCFLQLFLTKVFLFQNMISIVSFHQICALNHVQVQLSVGVLNSLLNSDFIKPVIHNAINS